MNEWDTRNDRDALERAAHDWFAQVPAIDVPSGDPSAVKRRVRALRRRRMVTRFSAAFALIVVLSAVAVLATRDDAAQVVRPPNGPASESEPGQPGPLFGPRSGASSVLLGDGTILMVGGRDEAQGVIYADAQRYDPATGTFHSSPPASEPRSGAHAVRVDDHVYLIGDWSTGNTTSSILDFDTNAETWSTVDASHAVSAGHATSVDGELVVVADDQSVAAWSPEREVWRELPTVSGLDELTFGELTHVTSAEDGTVIAVGFDTPGVPTVRLLPAGAQSWETVPAPPAPPGWIRTGYVEVAVFDGAVTLWGYAEREDEIGARVSIVARFDLGAETWATLAPVGARDTPGLWQHIVANGEIITWQSGEPAWGISPDGTAPAPWIPIVTGVIDTFAVDGQIVRVHPGVPVGDPTNHPDQEDDGPAVYETISPP